MFFASSAVVAAGGLGGFGVGVSGMFIVVGVEMGLRISCSAYGIVFMIRLICNTHLH